MMTPEERLAAFNERYQQLVAEVGVQHTTAMDLPPSLPISQSLGQWVAVLPFSVQLKTVLVEDWIPLPEAVEPEAKPKHKRNASQS